MAINEDLQNMNPDASPIPNATPGMAQPQQIPNYDPNNPPAMIPAAGAIRLPPNQPTGQISDYNYTPSAPTSLTNNQYARQEVNNLDVKKDLVQDEAKNLAKAQEDASIINGQAGMRDAIMVAQQQANAQKAMKDAQDRDAQIRSMVSTQYANDVDPERFWNSKSTAGKVTSVIGMILGGVGMGIAHRPGENPALDQLNKAITNDIESQKFNIDKNFKAISQLHGLNQDEFNRQTHGQVWQNNFRTAALERTKLDLAARAALSSSDTIKNNAKQGVLDIENEQGRIAHNNFLLAQQNLLNSQKKQEKLREDYGKDWLALVKEKGVDPSQASAHLMSLPQYAPLRNSMLKDANTQLKDEATNIMKNGLPGQIGPVDPETAKKIAAQNILQKNPQLGSLLNKPAEGPIVPAEKNEKTDKIENARIEMGANLDILHGFMKEADTIGGISVPGLSSKEARQKQDDYKAFVYQAVAAAYKARTGGVEPKNQEMVQHLAEPFLPAQGEDTSLTLKRMTDLYADLQNASRSATRLPTQLPPATEEETKQGAQLTAPGPARTKEEASKAEQTQQEKDREDREKNYAKYYGMP